MKLTQIALPSALILQLVAGQDGQHESTKKIDHHDVTVVTTTHATSTTSTTAASTVASTKQGSSQSAGATIPKKSVHLTSDTADDIVAMAIHVTKAGKEIPYAGTFLVTSPVSKDLVDTGVFSGIEGVVFDEATGETQYKSLQDVVEKLKKDGEAVKVTPVARKDFVISEETFKDWKYYDAKDPQVYKKLGQIASYFCGRVDSDYTASDVSSKNCYETCTSHIMETLTKNKGTADKHNVASFKFADLGKKGCTTDAMRGGFWGSTVAGIPPKEAQVTYKDGKTQFSDKSFKLSDRPYTKSIKVETAPSPAECAIKCQTTSECEWWDWHASETCVLKGETFLEAALGHIENRVQDDNKAVCGTALEAICKEHDATCLKQTKDHDGCVILDQTSIHTMPQGVSLSDIQTISGPKHSNKTLDFAAYNSGDSKKLSWSSIFLIVILSLLVAGIIGSAIYVYWQQITSCCRSD